MEFWWTFGLAFITFWSSWMFADRYLSNYAINWIKTKLIRKIGLKLCNKSTVKNPNRQFVSESYQPKKSLPVFCCKYECTRWHLAASKNSACRQTTQVLKFRTCQTSEFRIPDRNKITKSHFSEVSIHRKALYPTFPKTRSLIPPNCHYSDVPFSRKPQVPDSSASVIAPNFHSSDNHRIPT